MPAPTALLRKPDELAEASAIPLPDGGDDMLLDTEAPAATAAGAVTATEARPARSRDTEMHVDEEGRPRFAPAKDTDAPYRVETRKVPIPPHRMSPLKATWPKIYPPLVEQLKLQVRMNVKQRAVELRTSRHTQKAGDGSSSSSSSSIGSGIVGSGGSALQKGEDFVRAFALGFDVDDALALLRLDDLYIETFEVKDVKTLHGAHLGRAVGRIAGKDGKMKFAIENASRTRVVLADQKIHILGGFRNIHIAREAIVSLILGSPPSKVYGNLRTVAARMKERF